MTNEQFELQRDMCIHEQISGEYGQSEQLQNILDDYDDYNHVQRYIKLSELKRKMYLCQQIHDCQ